MNSKHVLIGAGLAAGAFLLLRRGPAAALAAAAAPRVLGGALTATVTDAKVVSAPSPNTQKELLSQTFPPQSLAAAVPLPPSVPAPAPAASASLFGGAPSLFEALRLIAVAAPAIVAPPAFVTPVQPPAPLLVPPPPPPVRTLSAAAAVPFALRQKFPGMDDVWAGPELAEF